MRDRTSPHPDAVALTSLIHYRERGGAIDLIGEFVRHDDLAELTMALGELCASLCDLGAHLVHALDHPDAPGQEQADEAAISILVERILESYGLAAARVRTSST